MRNRLCEMFGIEFPIFAFTHCRDVVAAVSRAGGMGVLGALAFSPEQLEIELKWIDEHVDGKPYGVDVVMPVKTRRPRGRPRRRQGHRRQLQGMIARRTGTTSTRCSRDHGVDPTAPERSRRRDRRMATTAGVLGWTDATGAPQIDIALAAPDRAAGQRARPAAARRHRPGPRAGREGGRARSDGSTGRARRRSRASTSSSPRATRPAVTPARWPRWCSSPTSSTPSPRCRCWPPAASARAGRWPRPWRSAPTACGPARSGSPSIENDTGDGASPRSSSRPPRPTPCARAR